jgi:hypothetical protein
MDIFLGLPTILLKFLEWLGEMIAQITVGWWVGKIRKYVADAITISDRRVELVSGVDPLRLRVRFKVHNGSASDIKLEKINLYLFCGGAPIGSVSGEIKNNPFVDVGGNNLEIRQFTIKRGNLTDVSVEITPSIYLWFWLLVDSGYDIRSSTAEFKTTWGYIHKSLDGDVDNKVKESKNWIGQFLTKVKTITK